LKGKIYGRKGKKTEEEITNKLPKLFEAGVLFFTSFVPQFFLSTKYLTLAPLSLLNEKENLVFN